MRINKTKKFKREDISAPKGADWQELVELVEGSRTYRRGDPGFLEVASVPEGGTAPKVALAREPICTCWATAPEPHTLGGVLSASYSRPSHLEGRGPI